MIYKDRHGFEIKKGDIIAYENRWSHSIEEIVIDNRGRLATQARVGLPKWLVRENVEPIALEHATPSAIELQEILIIPDVNNNSNDLIELAIKLWGE
jgi:hypothetical protein